MHVCLGTQPSIHHSGPSTTFATYFTRATTFVPFADCDTAAICWPTKERLLVLSSLAMRTLVHRFSIMSMVAIITMLCISSNVSKYRPNLSEEKECVGKKKLTFYSRTERKTKLVITPVQCWYKACYKWFVFEWRFIEHVKAITEKCLREISAPITK